MSKLQHDDVDTSPRRYEQAGLMLEFTREYHVERETSPETSGAFPSTPLHIVESDLRWGNESSHVTARLSLDERERDREIKSSNRKTE